jgi:hypothetical protein
MAETTTQQTSQTIRAVVAGADALDGDQVLYDYAEHVGDDSARELVVIRNDQRVPPDYFHRWSRNLVQPVQGDGHCEGYGRC